MKATRHEMHQGKSGLKHVKQVRFEVRAAREYTRYKTREVQEHVTHVRHESTYGTRYVRH